MQNSRVEEFSVDRLRAVDRVTLYSESELLQLIRSYYSYSAGQRTDASIARIKDRIARNEEIDMPIIFQWTTQTKKKKESILSGNTRTN